jgi:hypothetical protein
MWTITAAVFLCAAYLLGRITPPNELQQAYTRAEIAHVEHQTAVDAAMARADAGYSWLWRLLPLFGFTVVVIYLAGILYIDLVNQWAAQRD